MVVKYWVAYVIFRRNNMKLCRLYPSIVFGHYTFCCIWKFSNFSFYTLLFWNESQCFSFANLLTSFQQSCLFSVCPLIFFVVSSSNNNKCYKVFESNEKSEFYWIWDSPFCVCVCSYNSLFCFTLIIGVCFSASFP